MEIKKTAKNALSTFVSNMKKALREKDLPEPIKRKITKHLYLAAIVAFMGVLALLFMPVKGVSLMVIPFIVGFTLFIMGVVLKYRVVNTGYVTVEGKCIQHIKQRVGFKSEDSFVLKPFRAKLTGYLLDTQNGLMQVPINMGSFLLPEGTLVRVYVYKDEQTYFSGDVEKFISVICYEAVSFEGEEK